MLIHVYDELLLPLVRRMFNLEKFDLNVRIHRRKGLVDAKDLKEKIIDYMARLNQFTFNICSFQYLPVPVNILSNEEIERLFEKFPDNRIISCSLDCKEGHMKKIVCLFVCLFVCLSVCIGVKRTSY